MCKRRYEMTFDLQQFSEGGASAVSAAPNAAADSVQPAAEQNGGKKATGQQNSGKAPAETRNGGETPADSTDKDTAFEALIQGEYKAQFAARLAHAEGALQLARALAERYGLPEDDYAAIAVAAQPGGEAQTGEKGAAESEMSDAAQTAAPDTAQQPEPAAERDAPVQEADRPAPDPRRQTMEAVAQRICQGWVQQGMALRDIYPGFDFAAELKRADFAGLLRAGVSVKAAYEACHLQEILGGAMQYTADKVAAGVAARIADRANRPAENGATPRAGAVLKPDVNKLTRAQREQIARRVARGEKISF